MYDIYLESAAERDLKRLPPTTFHRVIEHIKSLAENLRPTGCPYLLFCSFSTLFYFIPQADFEEQVTRELRYFNLFNYVPTFRNMTVFGALDICTGKNDIDLTLHITGMIYAHKRSANE